MKAIQVTMFEAFDKSRFDTEDACREYEAEAWPRRFVGLTIEQVNDALDRRDTDLADAFERAGQRIAAARRESGELRRASPRRQDNGAGDPPEPPAPSEEPRAADPDFMSEDLQADFEDAQ